VRFSVSKDTTDAEVRSAVAYLVEIVEGMRS
jgi:hypothetical protein